MGIMENSWRGLPYPTQAGQVGKEFHSHQSVVSVSETYLNLHLMRCIVADLKFSTQADMKGWESFTRLVQDRRMDE